jgi:putative addiction module component (TIGR02574 family)
VDKDTPSTSGQRLFLIRRSGILVVELYSFHGDSLMALSMKDFGIDRLGVEDRLALAQEIWDSVAADLDQSPLTEGQHRELERRLAAHAASPENVIPWEEVKARALARARK